MTPAVLTSEIAPFGQGDTKVIVLPIESIDEVWAVRVDFRYSLLGLTSDPLYRTGRLVIAPWQLSEPSNTFSSLVASSTVAVPSPTWCQGVVEYGGRQPQVIGSIALL